MNELITIIKTIVPNELDQDTNVKTNSFILEPYMMNDVLKGDGKATESAVTYQLDLFFKNRGELVAKSTLVANAVNKYMVGAWSFTWESTARLWRATATIQKLI